MTYLHCPSLQTLLTTDHWKALTVLCPALVGWSVTSWCTLRNKTIYGGQWNIWLRSVDHRLTNNLLSVKNTQPLPVSWYLTESVSDSLKLPRSYRGIDGLYINLTMEKMTAILFYFFVFEGYIVFAYFCI